MGQLDQARRNDIPVSEPVVIQPIFVSGVTCAKIINGLLHIAYHVDCPDDWSGEIERIIKLRIIFPVAALDEARERVNEAVAACGGRMFTSRLA